MRRAWSPVGRRAVLRLIVITQVTEFVWSIRPENPARAPLNACGVALAALSLFFGRATVRRLSPLYGPPLHAWSIARQSPRE